MAEESQYSRTNVAPAFGLLFGLLGRLRPGLTGKV